MRLDPVAPAPQGQLGQAAGVLDGRGHGILVVFQHKDRRQIPDRRQVEGFHEHAVIGRTIRKEDSDESYEGPDDKPRERGRQEFAVRVFDPLFFQCFC